MEMDNTNRRSENLASIHTASLKEKKEIPKKITVLLKVYMHCPACEKLVYTTLKKSKGVETLSVDINENRATLFGRFKVEKVLKKLRKKTGKKAEILKIIEHEEEKKDDMNIAFCNRYENHAIHEDTNLFGEVEEDGIASGVLTLFNDENVNACTII